MDVNAKRVDNPLYKIIMYLNKYEKDALEDEKLWFLLKILNTHFKKLFYMIAHINEIQKDEEFIKKYDKTSVVSISTIEYCYYKISTIWDIAYQIADKLIHLNKKSGNKYDHLKECFQQYAKKLPNLSLDWYENLNKIRNKIVHGGITINSFYINNKNVEKKICFQAYNYDLYDLIRPHSMYTNIHNNNINFADNYFVFHTHLLYSYLMDFFDFVLLELSKGKSHDLDNLSLDNKSDELLKFHQTWLLSYSDQFIEITREMISLQQSEGHLREIYKCNGHAKQNSLFEVFPFYRQKTDKNVPNPWSS